MPREGILIRKPYERLSTKQIEMVHEASLKVLMDPGLVCFNREATEVFSGHGAEVTSLASEGHDSWLIRMPAAMVMDAIEKSPKVVTLGARTPENVLVLDGREARVFLISGSETNVWLDVDFPTYVNKSDPSKEVVLPEFSARRGTVADLCQSAHLCEHLDTLDGYIRTVNIQDRDIDILNKDVNKYFASLNNTTKHVQAGLTNIAALQDVVRMASIITGGEAELRKNPIISFITCLVKSPLQMVDDTTQSFMDICRTMLPVVVSSSPQAGTTAPMKEDGILAQINAEILAGITLGQLVKPGAPLIYGCVPVRARLDSLADSYGAPETSQYNVDCTQIARYYQLPCYATAGVSDTPVPNIQGSVERLFSDILVTLSGPQYLHCTFGLLDCNSTFSPLQAVMDDAHFEMLKFFLRPPRVDAEELAKTQEQIKQVATTPQRLYVKYIRPLMRSGQLSAPYPFEGTDGFDSTYSLANARLQEIFSRPHRYIDEQTVSSIFRDIPGLLPRLNPYA